MTIRDSGCGISEENQKKLFSNFSKLEEGAEMNKQGVGLGLSICREIIDANGGSVAITSKLGEGTDFIISLQTKCRIDVNQLGISPDYSMSEQSYRSVEDYDDESSFSSQESENI